MRRLLVAFPIAVGLGAAVALAQEPVQLSPGAAQELTEQLESAPVAERKTGYEIHKQADGSGKGVSFHQGDAYTGTFRRSTSPVTGRITHWVFDEGVFSRLNGDRYAGTYYFFHDVHNEREKVASALPVDGTYILVGHLVPKAGEPKPGIYYGRVLKGLPLRWIEADESFLAEIESSRRQQVAYYKEEIRREQAEADSGLSFGQILALSLGAAAISVADLPSADALQIGSAFATDVISGGQTSALDNYVANQQPDTGPLAEPEGPATASAAAGYQTDEVTITCPSGVSSVIPLSYKTQACRSAMIDFAKVYACNMIDDMSSAGAACESACGDRLCRE